jgi:catechol 2,3-dioxygenase-like lactoylglutathione lyase family enzyme
MLADAEAVANIPVKDIGKAKSFYEGTLGLRQLGTECDVLVLQSGNSKVYVYRSDYAGTNRATSMTWNVGRDLEGVVHDLQSKGVRFERYDIPGMMHQGDVHVSGDFKAAWFKDPDGNILSIVNS